MLDREQNGAIMGSIYSESAQRFLGALNRATREEAVFRDVLVHLDERRAGVMELRRIDTRLGTSHGTGRGTAALRRLCELADETAVALYVQPHSRDPALAARLRAWYLREGFTDEAEDGRLVRPAPRPGPAP